MTPEPENPYLGKTHYCFRPTSRMPQHKFLDQDALVGIQMQWDAAEAIRKAVVVTEVPATVERDDTSEEPMSKAEENRARVKFLSTKGATMQGWLAELETLSK